ncbi:hypothetical protein TNCV_1381101 [Trichonephila clavipes]|nr:hypothetical protein TNCV_1381101 [Trichonephila clavipes]
MAPLQQRCHVDEILIPIKLPFLLRAFRLLFQRNNLNPNDTTFYNLFSCSFITSLVDAIFFTLPKTVRLNSDKHASHPFSEMHYSNFPNGSCTVSNPKRGNPPNLRVNAWRIAACTWARGGLMYY